MGEGDAVVSPKEALRLGCAPAPLSDVLCSESLDESRAPGGKPRRSALTHPPGDVLASGAPGKESSESSDEYGADLEEVLSLLVVILRFAKSSERPLTGEREGRSSMLSKLGGDRLELDESNLEDTSLSGWDE